ncbi:16S rRNA (cytidine(1402)-2'-O)-methyltransferase [Halanaerobium sp. Z-7514]|uniref:Ribosomal RNA small subunit methyltransferase I n=1 Tax=Halanaerobium polyolivorans TaxID=2886943 RepID=A0AAW4X0C9_9FIRM|nr:16S rRNA (cytidine(1402)-2'-O)-methyltransferase [Halanaerobium polyolivorans]MCC3145266.1 16S rRNA (cytidine(1402)-2'-O)-methyltransferase [Halanaerobium polyolivorans]RQD78874.1 MAG: 16S rRNA (cytidine(1402)-2'-O)-methyltransferase [Halanaerobium sp. MSAO_Bac5]
MTKGKLYICGTPIGNLADSSQRLISTLKKVDLIACEDTRRSQKLLNHFSIEKKMLSYHEHNEETRSKELIEYLQSAKDIALLSDAGMPAISDPGQILIKAAVAAGIEVIPIPGPSAFLAALVVSGLDISAFVFRAFIPRSGKERAEFIEELSLESKTTVFYESPYRLKDTLKDLKEFSSELAAREAVVARELSKVHEEKYYGTTAELYSRLKDQEIKGEIVLVIAGRQEIKEESEGWEELSVLEHLKLLMASGISKKEAIKKVAKLRDMQKSEVYKIAIAISVDKD